MREASVGFWSDLSRAIFGTQEHAAYEVEDGMRAVAVLEHDRAEWGFIKNERYWITSNISVAALGGNFSAIGIINPPDSGVLAVVIGAVNTSASNAIVKVGRTNAAGEIFTTFPGFAPPLTTVPVITGCDAREYEVISTGPIEPNMASRLITIQTVGISATPRGFWGTSNGNNSFNAGMGFDERRPLAILRPGSYVALEATILAAAMSGFFVGRERPLFKGVRA